MIKRPDFLGGENFTKNYEKNFTKIFMIKIYINMYKIESS